MSFIDQVREKRKKLADVLVDEEYSGLRELVEELYPDKAHFIYELLQNAEDAGAKQVEFRLEEDRLVFAHDGRPFTEDDVWGITNIGKGTKREDGDKIGRFGVGFKAVFAYSETPSIWSPTFNFRISDLVLPTEIQPREASNRATVFQFPFNNQKKSAKAAFLETAEGLKALSEELLIFLQSIQLVEWEIAGENRGGLKRVEHPPHLIEVRKYVDQTTIASSCFLRFSKPVAGLPKQNVSLAFPLQAKADSTIESDARYRPENFRIVPAVPARVCVYFPAEKEVSGLRFHLHAPFVPELSRASVKDTPANDPLFDQLALLARESLEAIRDLDMLTVDFLNVLPHGSDILPARYKAIANAVTESMNNKPLTPTQSKKHKPAKQLLQGRAALKELLPADDLKRLFNLGQTVDWAVAAPPGNSHAERVLSGLDIQRWDVEHFIQLLERRTNETRYTDSETRRPRLPEPDKEFDLWFSGKDAEWFQKLYGLLYRERGAGGDYTQFKSLRIIRLATGNFTSPRQAFFAKDDQHDESNFPSVCRAVYASGRSTADQEAAKKFLAAVGVREVGEVEQVEAILRAHYTKNIDRSFVDHVGDLKRFVNLVRNEEKSAEIFANYRVLLNFQEQWSRGSDLYLDYPYVDTGLNAFFDAFETDARRTGISGRYLEAGVADLVCQFAAAAGAMTKLEIEVTSCSQNPNHEYLVRMAPGNPGRNRIDKDFWIRDLDRAILKPSVPLARLLWRTITEQARLNWTHAQYRNNQTHQTREALSRLAVLLKGSKWLPQHGGSFVIPAEAENRSLPEDFEFARGWKWLSAIGFGENVTKRSEEYTKKKELAAELGFEDDQALDDAKWFAQLGHEARRQLMSEYRRRTECELPEKSPVNPERRSEKIQSLADDAPEDEKEIRPRSVSIVTPTVKKEIRPYLREQYTNIDGIMICQICQHALPFSLPNRGPFFETVELVPDAKKVYFQNYIALCPNHAAMFKHVNESRDAIRELVEVSENCRIPVVLSGRQFELYFTKTHLADLRSVLATENLTDSAEL